MSENIQIFGAREHNLKNIDLTIPRNKLVVFTGLSGSGKSSLAFDTIFAEGQRRYIETFSVYARQFLGNLERPDVDKIEGLSPVVSIEQKTISKNPRSTVGTVTEIYDFIRLLFARVSTAFSFHSGKPMIKYSDSEIQKLILKTYRKQKILILAPVVRGRKGHYRELFQQILKKGFTKVRIDGEIVQISEGLKLDRYKIHDIEIIIDRLEVNSTIEKRLSDSISIAMSLGNNSMIIHSLDQKSSSFLSRSLVCPDTGISYPDAEPNLFSFNSPYGACKKCGGIGEVPQVDIVKIIPNTKVSIRKGGLAPLGQFKNNWLFAKIDAIITSQGYSLDTLICQIKEEDLNFILNGGDGFIGKNGKEIPEFEGIFHFLENQLVESSKGTQRWVNSFMQRKSCIECNGSRLTKYALYYRINGKNIDDIGNMPINEVKKFFDNLENHLSSKEKKIAKDVLKEIRSRLNFIMAVGLNYLSLNRSAKSLSGGEAQRIRLASQIGSELINVLYILDEPSIGLHQKDNQQLIQSLIQLRDAGNSLIVVEHDKEMMEASDLVVDIGPGAGLNGGKIANVFEFKTLKNTDSSITIDYLTGKKKIEIPQIRRNGNGEKLELIGAEGHNLKKVNLTIPLGKLNCITGVSGSGKSTLINQTLFPILLTHFYNSSRYPLSYQSIKGLEYLDKVIEIDQTPIGRTPRSNPATYTNVFNEIRNLFSMIPEARIRGYKPGRFSFNVKGGRCETCKGAGLRLIEMNFLPDVHVKCEDCNAKRYNPETLQIKFKGKNIFDVLEMNIDEAAQFFEAIPKISKSLEMLNAVGLGYIKLGQSSTTLSGGEAQRIKLATDLAKKSTGKTIYLLDEPSTGLHFEDIRLLLVVLNKLVDEGNTVLVIEHNLDIIKVADHVIDLGPEGGTKGGEIIAQGTPEEVAQNKNSHTAHYLAKELNN